ncbi:hypothetical protein QJS10_CPB13g00364 [Acorus calamus]|uniref:CBS domain-containing protein n=1 Tax=Acorus calamus TaxID=4465 RepID=A0AAV9DFL0_ACOCL|nr:hypothetical protein QJS10_CPB13g00364 [Acorus calamus]
MDSLALSTPLGRVSLFHSSASGPINLLVAIRGRRASPVRRRIECLIFGARKPSPATRSGGLMNGSDSVLPSNSLYKVGDFMTKKEDLYAVKPSTTIDEALQILVENRITGFPVINDDCKLVTEVGSSKIFFCVQCTHMAEFQVGVVSDYDLLALDSISGSRWVDTSLFPEVDRTWKTFNEIQRLLSKTNGKVVDDVMTPSPLVVHENTNLEDAVRLLLETKFRRLPVVDGAGKLVGIITRGNMVRAALQIKRASEN